MKHLLLFLTAIILITTNSFSQIKQGTWMAGGNLGSSGTSTKGNSDGNLYVGSKEYHTKGGNFNANLGYFLRDNLVIGLSPGYSLNVSSNNNQITYYSSSNNYSLDKYHSDGYSISPFIRKYKQLFNSKVYLFGQASAILGYSNTASGDVRITPSGDITWNRTSSTKATSESINFSPGINYFITDRIALEVIFAGLGFGVEQQKINEVDLVNNLQSSTKNTSFNHHLGLNLSGVNLGVQFFLGKKQEASKKEGL